jgi:hypothetical protein
MSTATGYQYVESVDLLLSNGWEYSGLTGPPEDLNVEASRHCDGTADLDCESELPCMVFEIDSGVCRLYFADGYHIPLGVLARNNARFSHQSIRGDPIRGQVRQPAQPAGRAIIGRHRVRAHPHDVWDRCAFIDVKTPFGG